MHIVMFYPSLISDWNNGNAHFLRGMALELIVRGHKLSIYEPKNAWCVEMLRNTEENFFNDEFRCAYPLLESYFYDIHDINLDQIFDSADLAIIHEWNDTELVNRIANHHKNKKYKLLFHDTHHRSLSDPGHMRGLHLNEFDGVLAYGQAIREIYMKNGWCRNVWVWHEAADVRIFKPLNETKTTDLIWIGNWGDDERTAELNEFLIKPAKMLKLKTEVYGVRYSQEAVNALENSGIAYKGWIPNFMVPRLFAKSRVTVHIPRNYYVRHLPGIPTIRPFEAMACGIPLVCSPWSDCENLFSADADYLTANNADEMGECLKEIFKNRKLADSLSKHGRETILKKHTCGHRADELLEICSQLGISQSILFPNS